MQLTKESFWNRAPNLEAKKYKKNRRSVDDLWTGDLDVKINKTNLIFVGAFRIYLTCDELKKTHETRRLNQGTSAGKPKRNGDWGLPKLYF